VAVCIPDLPVIWPVSAGYPIPADPENPTDEELAALVPFEIALELAWTSMQVLTAYQLALCPITVRPCKQSCNEGSYVDAPVGGYGAAGAPFYPNVRNGVWTNIWCGHTSDCACSAVEQLQLPSPVGAVTRITIDGAVVDPAAYRIDNGNWLVRQDGGSWPTCQDMNAPEDADGTFVVTMYRGAVADRTVLWAVGVLAAEWLLAINQDEACRLPAGTTSVARQGLQFDIETLNLFEDGSSGIPEVDAVIARFNPFRQKMPPQLYSLDRKPQRQTTWTS
jgi:hypothetical protein